MGKLWLYIVVLITPIYFRGSDKGISAIDIVFGIFLVGSLFFWIFKKLVIDREKLIENTGEWLIVFFFIALAGNFFVALFNNVEAIDWLREYAIALPVLYFLPIKYYFSDSKDLSRLLIVLGIGVLVLNFTQFYGYYKLSYSNLVYAYQIGRSLKENQCAFTASAILPLIFALYQKSFWKRMLLMLLSAVSVLALITTFSRTFWLIVLLEIILLFLLVGGKYKFRIIRYIAVASIIFLGVVLVLFKSRSEVVFAYVEQRFVSTAKGKQDISVLGRLYEYGYVWNKVKESPLGGTGLGNEFSFFNPITLNTRTQNFVHNGYLHFLFKMGFPLTIVFVFLLIYYLIYSFGLAVRIEDKFYKCVAISAFCLILLMIIANFSAHNFFLRDGTFILAFAFAFTSIAQRKCLGNVKFSPLLVQSF